jgi:3-vinyl bacteriochlorophyllide hydratase
LTVEIATVSLSSIGPHDWSSAVHFKEADRLSDDHGAGSPTASLVSLTSSQHSREILSNDLYSFRRESVAAPANAKLVHRSIESEIASGSQTLKLLYTPEQRLRRDATRWTLVQGILAPVQFVVFLVSAILVVRFLVTGSGFEFATISIVAKTMLLYAIMITGAIWEREVFGVYLFAPAFFWEDVFSFLVLTLHSAYLVALLGGYGSPREQMLLALAAYATYVVNATQFILKLRAARRDERLMAAGSAFSGSAA